MSCVLRPKYCLECPDCTRLILFSCYLDFCSIKISALPACCLVNISFATVFCLLGVHAQWPLPSHGIMECLILILRPYNVSGRGPIFNPCHHSEQNVMLGVRETGHAVNIVS